MEVDENIATEEEGQGNYRKNSCGENFLFL
jgi:hypothetical protein